MTLIDKPGYEAAFRLHRVARRLAVMPKPAPRPSGWRLPDWPLCDEELRFHDDMAPDQIRSTDPHRTSAGPAGSDARMAFLIAVVQSLHRRFDTLDWHVADMHHRFDTLDRHASDIMLLQHSAQELIFGKRRPFSRRSRDLIVRVLGGEPYKGRCPCCMEASVLAEGAQAAPGAEFDHFFNCSLNKPEFGWLICKACHHGLTHDGYLARFARLPAFRSFQAAVLRQRSRAQMRPGDDGGGR